MAEQSNQPVLEALQRAMAEPAGMPLHAQKKSAGIFAATAPGRKAAQFCKDQGYLRTLRLEPRGKTTQEVCAITEEGLAYLLSQTSARPVLESLVRAVEARQTEVGELAEAVRRLESGLDALRTSAAKVLQEIQHAPPAGHTTHGNGNGVDATQKTILAELIRWHASDALEDCPLPHLYRCACRPIPALTIGQFHDALRGLQECMQVYLHPWTGPLYEIPEPALALMAGHEIAYYASLRK